MKYSVLMIAAMACTCAFASAPEVTVTSVAQDASRAVRVNYTLTGEPAVITVYAETNRGDDVWIDIGAGNVTYCTGDINKLVQVGSRQLVWRADKSWPNHKINDGSIRVGVKAWATNAPPDYMVVDLDQQNVIRYYTSVEQLPGGLTNKQYRTRKLVMRKIPAAGVTWRMGQPAAERVGLNSCMLDTGEVTLSADYYMGIYKLTAYQFYLITGIEDFSGRSISSMNAWGEPIAETPARKISYLCARSELHSNSDDAAFRWPAGGHAVRMTGTGSLLGFLRTKSGVEFDLPTEAQWEYAFRAGEADACYLGGLCTREKIESLGWTDGNNVRNIDGVDVTCHDHPVGQKIPNNWGLYDMVGNGREWVLNYHTDNPADIFGVDPVGPQTQASNGQQHRTTRTAGDIGKSWADVALSRGGYIRNIQDSTFSVRVACPAIVPATAQ